MANTGTKRTIMIVEDELPLRNMLSEVLALEGPLLEIATNGQEAITLLENAPSKERVMLLDLFMPILDGWGVVRWLVEHPDIRSRTKIVLMSANVNLKQAGGVEHDAELPKPFNIDDMLAVVQSFN